MALGTTIEWTDATWNPVSGCTKITRGCDNCYAERFAERFRGVKGHPFESGFDLTLRPHKLREPLSWRSPKRIFVNSMSDLFHKEIPRNYIDQVFETMELAHWHVFQVLTKRSSLLRRYVNERYAGGAAPAHIWLGVSVEDRQALVRLKHLQSGPGARTVMPEWIRSIRDQCAAQGVAFFFKQWGGRTSKAGGNRLDGRRWLQYPRLATVPSG